MPTSYNASDASDALNLAAAYMVKVTSKTNDLLDKLRKAQVESLNKLVYAMYSSANAEINTAICEGLSQLAMAGGGMSSLRDADKAHDGLAGLQEDEKGLQTEKDDLESKLSSKKFDKDKNETEDTVTEALEEKKKSLTTKTKEREAKQTTANNKSTRAQQKSNIYQQASLGIAALPKAVQQAIQNQASALKEIMQNITGMLSTSYDKSNAVVQSFLNMNNLIGAIAGLSAIQLR